MMTYDNYFELRKIAPDNYSSYALPAYLSEQLGRNKSSKILDFGCGFGQTLEALRRMGHVSVEGIDIEPNAIEHCKKLGFTCYDGIGDVDFFDRKAGAYDYIIMSHVLEHLPKSEMVPQLKNIHALLKPDGKLIVAVPNAQSNTGAYWRYEDFTHHYLFTSGSIYYVLAAAGFKNITYLDVDCTTGLNLISKYIRRSFLYLYRLNYKFWNKITASAIHAPSPMIFSYEIKVLASK